jgi:hypothetical protein
MPEYRPRMNRPIAAILAAAAATMIAVLVSSAAPEASTAQTDAASSTNTVSTTNTTNKVTLKFVKVDSEETAGEDGHGSNAVDGKTDTFWHTQWQDDSPALPHYIIIELVPPTTIKGFTYLPRQDDQDNGTIKEYEFYVSDDGKDFGKPVKKGTLEEGKEKKTATFAPVKCHFFKLVAISEINGNAWTSAAEIGIVQDK